MILPKEVEELTRSFRTHNEKLYIVGGAVRDYLLGNTPYDFDFTTTALPDKLLTILEGYKLDTYKLDLGSVKVIIDDKKYEITTLRVENGVINTRYPEEIKFTNDLRLDSLRRDFTINALYYDGKVYDYHHGIDDLKAKIIRFIGDPKTRIKEDPVRILRAIRFSLLLGFNIDNDSYNEIVNNKELIQNPKVPCNLYKYHHIWFPYRHQQS